MSSRMVRKQFYILKRHDLLLKRLAQARGVSEAEIIRQVIEREASGGGAKPLPELQEQTPWEELIAFLEERRAQALPGEPYRWNRQEIYEERESRWLRDRDQD